MYEAEQAVLGSILIDPACLSKLLDFLDPADFQNEGNSEIYRVCGELDRKGIGVDSITVARELARLGKLDSVGGAAYFSTLLANVPTSLHAEYYGQIVREAAMRRKLASMAFRLQESAKTMPLDELIKNTEEELNNASRKITDLTILDARQMAHDGAERYTSPKPRALLKTTGITALNFKIGGFADGEMVIIGARPSQGKTSLMLWCALQQAIAMPVLFCSLEMTSQQIIDKCASILSGVPVERMRQGLTDDDKGKLNLAMGELSERKLHVLDMQGGVTVSHIKRAAERCGNSFGISVLYIDYLGLLSDEHGRSRYERIGFISRQLKNLTRTLNIPVLVACQLNRMPEQREDKRPNLSDLRDAGDLEQDADLVVFLYRESMYSNEADPTRVELSIAKNRMTDRRGILELKYEAGKYK